MQVIGAVQSLTHATLVGVKVEKRNSHEEVLTLTGLDGQQILISGTAEDLMDMLLNQVEIVNTHTDRIFNKRSPLER